METSSKYHSHQLYYTILDQTNKIQQYTVKINPSKPAIYETHGVTKIHRNLQCCWKVTEEDWLKL